MIRSQCNLRTLALLATILSPQGAWADSNVHIYANVNQNYESSPIPPLVNRDLQSSGPGLTQAADTVTLHSDGPSARTASGATAIATEGTLWIRSGSSALVKTGHYDSQGNAYMPSQGASADAEARASFTDMVTISDPARTGQPGTASALLQLSGGAGAAGTPYVSIVRPDGGFLSVDSRAYGRVSIAGNGLTWSTQTWDDACSALGIAGWMACANALGYDPGGTNNFSAGAVAPLPVELNFVFGQPFALSYTLYANSQGQASTSYYKMTAAGDGTGDGLVALDWGGITQVVDASGSTVVGYAVTSESGFDYGQPAPAPEPQSGVMLSTGIAFLGWLRTATRGGRRIPHSG